MSFLLITTIPNDTIMYLRNIHDNIETIKNIVDISNSTIANEISSVNMMLVAFTIVFALVGVFLGIYITWLKNIISKMNNNIKEKETKIIGLANIVEETDKKIHSDISSLYAELRNEESMTLLRRLEEETQENSNLSDLLLARPLSDKGFPILKQAFIKLKSLGSDIEKDNFIKPSYSRQYTIMFFQHYLRESILDDDLRPEIIKDFGFSMECAFKRDIIKSTEDFCHALSVNNAPFDKVALLVDYLKALNQSKYCNLIELKNIFQENVNKDTLVEAIDKCTIDEVYLALFDIEAPDKSKETNNNDTATVDNSHDIDLAVNG